MPGPTALSSTDVARRHTAWHEAWGAVRDLAPLLRFRAAGLRARGRRGAAVAFCVILVLTVLAGWAPAYLPTGDDRRTEVLLLLASGYVGVLIIAVVSAIASGGGRELLPRDQAVAFPVSTTTDHLGALLMAPLNIAWLLQAWTLLGATAYVVGPKWQLMLAQVPVLVWLFAATAIAQVAAWGAEWVRRGPHGIGWLRAMAVTAGAVMAFLVVTDRFLPVLNQSPTVRISYTVLDGADALVAPWLQGVAILAVTAVAAVVGGALVARAVARRPARDELRVESSHRPPRENPTSDLMALVRTDRVSIWRSVALRRGLLVLAVLPGLVALAGAVEWDMLSVLPGLVASGGTLLFGVNAWCLDGRGALWRDSLPVPAGAAFASRVYVLVEVLFLATVVTLVLASLRAGVPTVSQVVAVGCAAVVVSLQVVASSMRWSIRRPFAVDLRSARATPAPPLVMVGYSARLAFTTTLTGLVFAATATTAWHWSLFVAVPFVLFAASRLVRAAAAWTDLETRSRVIATVAS